MADYNTFAVIDCKARKLNLVTSSARKAGALISKGKKIEVWNRNALVLVIYNRDKNKLEPFFEAEKAYIAKKQERAESRNRKR